MTSIETTPQLETSAEKTGLLVDQSDGGGALLKDDDSKIIDGNLKKSNSEEKEESSNVIQSSTDQSASFEKVSKPISNKTVEDSVVHQSNTDQSESIQLKSKPISNETVEDSVVHQSNTGQSESIELESKPISTETVEDSVVLQSNTGQSDSIESDSSNKTLANEKSEISGLSTPVVVIVEIQEEEEDKSKSDSCKEEEEVKEKIEVINDSSILVSQSGKGQLSNCKESNIPAPEEAEPKAKVSSGVSEQKPPIARNRKSTGKLSETAPARPAAPVLYPGDLNPFGDDEEEEEEKEEEPVAKSRNTKQQQQSSIKVHYPTDLNPFGDEPETEAKPTGLSLSRSPSASASLNPFGSDEEDEEEALSCHSLTPMPSPVPRKSLMNGGGGGDGGSRNGFSTPSPTAPHKSSRLKKRQAPAPPPSPLSRSAASLSASNNPSNNEDTGSISSRTSSVSQSRTPTPVPRQSKQGQLLLPPVSPAPGRRRPCSPPSPTLHQMPALPKPDSLNESQLCTVGARMKAIKSKKRPAPPIPAYRRCIKSSVAEMELELEKIGDELPTVEKRRKELEQWLIDNRFAADQDTSTAAESESLEGLEQKKKDEDELDKLYKKSALEFIELAKHRCKLARKQKELMYMKREHKLEETQADIEFRLRVIMSKQDVHKTPEDKQDEKELLDRLMEIIDERNDIIENMIRDENREIEEYQLIVSKVIPAEPEQSQPAKPAAPDFETLHRHKSHKPHQHHSLSSFLKLKKKKKDKNKKNKETKEEDSSNGLGADEVDGDSERVSLADQSAGSVSNLTNTSSDTSLNSRTAPDHKDHDSQGPAQSPNDDHKDKSSTKKHHKHFTLSKSTLKKLSPMHAAADLIHRKKEAKNTTSGGPSTVTAPAPVTGQTTN